MDRPLTSPFLNLTLIAATDNRGAIGKDNDLPWPRLSQDMSHFMRTTQYHPVIMGRKTWESTPKNFRPFANRTNIVLSTTTPPHTDEQGVIWCTTPYEALLAAAKAPGGNDVIYVIGGGQIYELFAPAANRQVITKLDLEVANPDTYFPSIPGTWKSQVGETFTNSKHDITGTIHWMVRDDSERQMVVIPAAARGPEKKLEYQVLNTLGLCPFCEGGFTWQQQELVLSGTYWGVFHNFNPYRNSEHHLLFVPKRHLTHSGELSPEELLELQQLKNESCKLCGETEYVFVERQFVQGKGDPSAVGQSVVHFHCQLVVPQRDKMVEMWFGPPGSAETRLDKA